MANCGLYQEELVDRGERLAKSKAWILRDGNSGLPPCWGKTDPKHWSLIENHESRTCKSEFTVLTAHILFGAFCRLGQGLDRLRWPPHKEISRPHILRPNVAIVHANSGCSDTLITILLLHIIYTVAKDTLLPETWVSSADAPRSMESTNQQPHILLRAEPLDALEILKVHLGAFNSLP